MGRPRSNQFVLIAFVLAGGCQAGSPCSGASVPVAQAPLARAARAVPLDPSANGEGVPFSLVRRKNYRIEFDGYALEADPVDGARILEFSLAGKSIIVPVGESPEAFGSSIWPSPQSDWNWPPPPELDRLPWQVQSDPKSLVMQSATSEKLGLAVRQRITAQPASGSMLLEYEFANRGATVRKVAPWQNTRVRPKGVTFYPASQPSYAYRNNSLTLTPEGEIVWFRHEPANVQSSQKSFADGEEGWLAYLDDRLLFIKIFDDVRPFEQAPEEGEVVIYVHVSGKFVEVENQGAYRELSPGSTFTWRTQWVLRLLPPEISGKLGDTALVAFVRNTVRRVRQSN